MSYYQIYFNAPGKGKLFLNSDGRIVTTDGNVMQFATESEASEALAVVCKQLGDVAAKWTGSVELIDPDAPVTVVPGEYYGGDLGGTLYKVTICEDCGLPALKKINEQYFSMSSKGAERRKQWQADKKRLPYDLEICDCAHNQDDEEED